ncbi:MAG: 23S rRNA (uracil(1939)-C(5))-methyltransferase RlmD [Planctomycetota bacterium]
MDDSTAPDSDDGATGAERAVRVAAGKTPRRKPRRGDRFELEILRIDDRGRGLAEADGHRFRLRHANPGARVEAEVTSRRGGRVDARVVRTLDPGPHADDARCPHAGTCGGCALPTLAYEEQLRQKRLLVERALAEAGLSEVATVHEVEPAARLVGYRNKMDFTFGNRRYVLAEEPEGAEADFALGLHAPGLHHKVLDVTRCAIAFDGSDEIRNDVRELARTRGLTPWNLRDHEGLLRHLVLRRGVRTGETMVDLVTSERAAPLVDPLIAELLERHPSITTVVQNVTTRLATVAYGETEFVLHGPGTIDEVLAGQRFRISADSFFQTNTEQAERLFELVADAAEVEAGERLFDVYCGAGTIGLAIAPPGAEIVGFESAPSAVRDARQNADRNGRSDAVFHEGDVLETLRSEAHTRAPHVLVVDPPRAGLHPRVPRELAALGARRLVFVSCNPRTGARDVAELVREGYALVDVRPIDLFPHTPHVEVVFRLERAA